MDVAALLAQAPEAAEVDPRAAPYAGGPADGPPVLVVHGFSGSPRSMRPWAEDLAAHGFRVDLPRLPGHGTSWRELNVTGWPDWYAAAERALLRLADATGRRVGIGGLSMGGALALRLAQRHPDLVHGLVLVNPVVNIVDPRLKVLRLIRLVTPSLGGIAGDVAKPGADEGGYGRTPLHALASQRHLWAAVRLELADVRTPLLVYRSRQDHVADPSSVALIQASTTSPDRTFVVLERSYHVATLDHEAHTIFAGSVDFFTRLAG
ncbi:alpha/beta hydrolase [Microlunatus antarcticus]|uniref:Carboxylesterase n=1 Tax=Microlunatus antarcticus TaxID=53388 RepID=A0A7W5JXU3_9ACTN|nr:alpha/beta fold hydrolase [Microlunatus antarcticus]MBB3328329.1 carboxylesterase [Microlunatus antarcticus]